MGLVKDSKVLVLNRSWRVLGVTNLDSAISKVASFYSDGTPKAKIIDIDFQSFDWQDWTKMRPKYGERCIKTVSSFFRIPEIIQFTKYDRIPSKRIHYNRRTIYLRDNNKCQYCNSKNDLSLDHVVPKCQGGLTNWENVVVACVKCNLKKAGRTPDQAGMKLLKRPIKPKHNLFTTSIKVKSWEAFLGEAYWITELDHDGD